MSPQQPGLTLDRFDFQATRDETWHSKNDAHDQDSVQDNESDIDSEDEEFIAFDTATQHSLNSSFYSKSERSSITGPEQNVDIMPSKSGSFRKNLATLENRFHNLTVGLFDEKVYCTRATASGGNIDMSNGSGLESFPVTKKKQKAVLDSFDKLLGLRTRNSNPIVALTSGYLGPVMNMYKIWLSVVRVSFNVSFWKDPYLSFWVLCFLVAMFFIMAIFPWRSFVLVVGVILVGPQVSFYICLAHFLLSWASFCKII